MPKNRKKRPKKSHIKHNKYEDLNISSLDDHPRQGSTLKSPFSVVGNTTFISWRDHAINENLWSAIIRSNFSQEMALKLFRDIISTAYSNDPIFKETYITHSTLSVLSDEHFDLLLSPILKNKDAKNYLSALLYIDSLPDKHHWERHLIKPTPESHAGFLMKAVADCYDHQSQEATDVRWFRLLYCVLVRQNMHYPEKFSQRLEEWRLYPNLGDQRTVRPSIRASEIMLRSKGPDKNYPFEIPSSIADKIPEPWHDQFWSECMQKTECILGDLDFPSQEQDQLYFDQFFNIYRDLSENFIQTTTTSSLDARRDATYGLVLYSLLICIAISRNKLQTRAEGRILLRTVVESYITLKYLAYKDDAKTWLRFRDYGTGQSKLAFLKNLRETSIPDFINLDDLHKYANEDLWQEYADIELKPWSEQNLRNMANEAGIKDFYDKHYDWTSAYVHGNWGAIRETVFTVCLNPLHRFHRVPYIPRLELPSVLSDAAKTINLMLDITSSLFPIFKTRIKHK